MSGPIWAPTRCMANASRYRRRWSEANHMTRHRYSMAPTGGRMSTLPWPPFCTAPQS